MWIRSQDKKILIDAKSVYIYEQSKCPSYRIGVITNSNVVEIGQYTKKETALEILDMIQLRIVQSYLRKRHKPTRCLANAEDVVFEMPKDVPDVREA